MTPGHTVPPALQPLPHGRGSEALSESHAPVDEALSEPHSLVDEALSEPRASASGFSQSATSVARALMLLVICAGIASASRYSHRHPKHAPMECAKCHEVRADATLRQPSAMPGHVTCTGCHNLADDAIRREEPFCGNCHTSAATAIKNAPALHAFPRAGSPTPDSGIQFSHVGHAKTKRCTDCHHAAEPARAATPLRSHPACFECHNERPASVAIASWRDCATCHVAGTPTYTSWQLTNPKFRHADHQTDTRPRRKADASKPRPADYLCRECHSAAAQATTFAAIVKPKPEQHCVTCHNGKPGLPDPLREAPLR